MGKRFIRGGRLRQQRRLCGEGLEPRYLMTVNPNSIPTVGVYDENILQANQVDFSATSLTSSQFAADVAAAYNAEQGGVINGSVLGAFHSFGALHDKVLSLLAVGGTNWGIGAPNEAANGPRTISESGAFASTTDGGYNFTSFNFVPADNMAANEQVVEFGVTTLSITSNNYGVVTVTARLSNGNTLTGSRAVSEAVAAGDTFFGFAAPPGLYFTGFSLAYSGTPTQDNRLWFDDIGFVTAVVTPNTAPTVTGGVFQLPENSPAGTAVGAVVGTDLDGDPLLYSIVAGNSGGAFQIDNSGAITVANSGALDFETTPQFVLTIEVMDPSGATGQSTVTVDLTDVVEPIIIPVLIDIDPRDDANVLRLNGNNRVQVAILSTATFDAQTVIVSSLTFGPTGNEDSLSLRRGNPRFRYRDVDHDGRLDLVVAFDLDRTGFQVGDTLGIVRGQTDTGDLIEGSDFVDIRNRRGGGGGGGGGTPF